MNAPPDIVYTKNTLGDFLHKVVPLYYFLKFEFGLHCRIVNTGGNAIVDECLRGLVQESRLKGIGAVEQRYIATLDGKYSVAYNKQFYTPEFRRKVIQAFRLTFFTEADCLILNPVTINIGSLNKNRSGNNNNLLFQDRMAELIARQPSGTFNVMGFTRELVSDRLKAVLGLRAVVNLLDQTPGLSSLLRVLFHSRVVIVRNTGILHLAGLCNTKVITLYANNSVVDDVQKFIGWRADVRFNGPAESAHLYYTEKWSPLSDHTVSIIEYKGYAPGYNRRVVDLIEQHLPGAPLVRVDWASIFGQGLFVLFPVAVMLVWIHVV